MGKTTLNSSSALRTFLGCTAALLGGAAALGYEVAWSKILVVPLGNSADATAIVLAAFMLGMAVGAAWLGRLGDSVRRPLRLYGLLELALGGYAVIAPRLLLQLDDLDIGLASPVMAQLLKLAAAVALVALPSMAMGAALPLLLRALTSGASSVSRRVGLVYGANTLGAALGALLAGYFAIPTFGLSMTSLLAAGASAGCAVLALLTDLIPTVFAAAGQPEPATREHSKSAVRLGLLAAGVCGAVTMGAEVLWTRLLTFVFGHDTYAFAALLTVVLLGLSLGGLVFHIFGRRDPVRFTCALCGWLGAFLLVGLWVAAAVVLGPGRDPLDLESSLLGASLGLEAARQLAFAPILVGLPAVASGALLPAAISLFASGRPNTGARVGFALLVNGTAGAAGSLLVSFGLIGWLGLERALIALSCLAFVASGLALLVDSRGISRLRRLALGAPLATGLAVLAVLPADLPKAMLLEAVGSRHQELVFYEEGRTATVSITVNKINGEKQLFVNAVNEVTTRLVHDQSFKLLGHLGPLLHPRPKQALMICLGAGLAAGAALTHPLSSLEIAELSSTVPRAARLWKQENHGALDDPLTHLIIADGRHYLAVSATEYDVIIVDSTHPKSVDSWLLYTAEFYELARRRLAGNGLLVQWVPLHGLSERELKIIVRTFQSVFPETTLWANVGFEIYGQAAYLKLVGSREPLIVDYAELELRLKEPRIAADLTAFGMDQPVEILDTFLANPEAVEEWTRHLPVQHDDRPIVPYITRYTAGRRMEAPLLLAVRTPPWGVISFPKEKERAESLTDELTRAYDASGFLLAGLLDRAAEAFPASRKIPLFQAQAEATAPYYGELARLYPDDPDKLFEIGSYLGNLGYHEQARAMFQQALALDPTSLRVRLNLALVHMDLGEVAKARDELESLAQAHQGNPLVQYNLGVARRLSGDAAAAIESLVIAHAALRDMPGVSLALAGAYLDLGQRDEAKPLLEELVRLNPFDASTWDWLGLLAAAGGDYETARVRHVRALELEPYRRDSHFNLGLALSALGRLSEAEQAFAACLRIEPKDADAAFNLGATSQALGKMAQAVDAYRTAVELDPSLTEAKSRLERLLAASR